MTSSLGERTGTAAPVGERHDRPAPRDTRVDQLARFVCGARFEDISEPAREFGGAPLVTLIGAGKGAPDRAALYNGALVRHLDFNDSFLAPGETCHPSDNIAPVLAIAIAGTSLNALRVTRTGALSHWKGLAYPPRRSVPPTRRFRIRVHLRDGRVLGRERHDYGGFHSRPMSWDRVEAKFDRLASGHVDERLRTRIKDAVGRLDTITIDEPASELAAVPSPIERQSQ